MERHARMQSVEKECVAAIGEGPSEGLRPVYWESRIVSSNFLIGQCLLPTAREQDSREGTASRAVGDAIEANISTLRTR